MSAAGPIAADIWRSAPIANESVLTGLDPALTRGRIAHLADRTDEGAGRRRGGGGNAVPVLTRPVLTGCPVRELFLHLPCLRFLQGGQGFFFLAAASLERAEQPKGASE
jgi:hypothetical protein